jgi:PilZ domain-containing protein
MANSEQRRGRRVDVEFFAVEVAGTNRYYRLVRNISEDGLFFEVPPGWETGTPGGSVILELEPEIVGEVGEISRLEGTVVHAGEKGVGVRLTHVPPAARTWLRRLTSANA